MKYYIQRTIGKFTDTLSQLWEGSDMPTFRRDGNPYCFTCIHEAKRVLNRLKARYPKTRYAEMPVNYNIESIDTTLEVHHAPEQHPSMFI
jgi:uncharacterized Zn finger protein (UPF0148 family)